MMGEVKMTNKGDNYTLTCEVAGKTYTKTFKANSESMAMRTKEMFTEEMRQVAKKMMEKKEK